MKTSPNKSIPPMPARWANGFTGGDYVRAAGGTETPHFSNGAWRLNVCQKSTGQELVYNYATDIFEEKAPEEALLKGQAVLPPPPAVTPAPARPTSAPEV